MISVEKLYKTFVKQWSPDIIGGVNRIKLSGVPLFSFGANHMRMNFGFPAKSIPPGS